MPPDNADERERPAERQSDDAGGSAGDHREDAGRPESRLRGTGYAPPSRPGQDEESKPRQGDEHREGSNERGEEGENRDEDKKPKSHRVRWIVIGVVALVVIILGATIGRRWLITYFTTESTDDAFVNGHYSYISPRVSGNIIAVYVDDNDRVRQGDLLLEIDHEPYQVALAQKQAALNAAEANLSVALADVRSQEAAARANWYTLVNAQEQVRYQIATLHSNVANLKVQEAQLDLADKETKRAERLVKRQAATKEELDQRRAAEEVARQQVASARETVRRTRAALGLPPNDSDPTAVPPNLEDAFSAVQTALSNAARSLVGIGIPLHVQGLTPEGLRRQLAVLSPTGDVDEVLDRWLEKAPAVQQARAARDQAREDVRNAGLNLQYTYVYAPIDGQIAGRSANPGYNVAAGQTVMSVRSLTDIWIDANFKETQLDYIRIGMPVNVYVDAYPHKVFRGRVEGFSAGTGSTQALIPPENATGNYVKIVQRLPVRITINPEDMTPDTPLFVGLSVEPYVLFKEQPTGPNAGDRLQTPIRPNQPRPHVPPPASGTGSQPHLEPPPPNPYGRDRNGTGSEARHP
jgi:membrane fusion protein, multidrug efflux system